MKAGLQRRRLSLLEKLDAWAGAALARAGRHAPFDTLGNASTFVKPAHLQIAALAAAVGGIVSGDKKLARAGLNAFIAASIAYAGAKDIKKRVARSRPDALIRFGVYVMRPARGPSDALRSFPSGHAAASVAVASAIAPSYSAIGAMALPAAVCVSAMKVVQGRHFPLDILVGALIGAAAERATRPFFPAPATPSP